MTNSPDQEAVLAANQAFYDAFSSKELGNMNRLWWQGSSSLCIHPGGGMLVGWDTIQASWKSIFSNTDSIEIDVEVIKVEVDQAIAYIVVRETVLQSSRGRKLKAQSIATNIFQKMAQKWYLVQHHGSPIMR
ncbi:nuclear transport factor 2 family protein [Pleurocapsa sp. FMAR1]|uniref:nuclear transport factor 2 family protein n=1 Tax=Pleurocapsa sp. FMAR1 TaxID=3040204 RepID=UPI0029C63B91|nr:nuclear transport factor 2 family protein [Pleurocapsa sp. FMAR1]